MRRLCSFFHERRAPVRKNTGRSARLSIKPLGFGARKPRKLNSRAATSHRGASLALRAIHLLRGTNQSPCLSRVSSHAVLTAPKEQEQRANSKNVAKPLFRQAEATAVSRFCPMLYATEFLRAEPKRPARPPERKAPRRRLGLSPRCPRCARRCSLRFPCVLSFGPSPIHSRPFHRRSH